MSQSTESLLTSTELRKWTEVSRFRNLACILGEYLCLLALHAANIYLMVNPHGWEAAGWLVVPMGIFTILMTGCLMHRIGLLGHEASHGLIYPDRRWNDILADLLCFFPMWSCNDSYRAKHLGHHLHPNDPQRDPNMAGHKTEQLYARFPMPRPSFIWNYYAKFFWPPFVLGNLIDLVGMLSFNRGPKFKKGDEADGGEGGRGSRIVSLVRSPTFLGFIYLIAFTVVTRRLIDRGDAWVLFWGELACLLLAVVVWHRIPAERFRYYKKRSPSAAKNRALFRFVVYTLMLAALGWSRFLTGFHSGGYYLLFWVLPLVYVFPYLMLLREIYQHANLGQGNLDNSRIIHADWFTRWAVLGYGNDFHLIHHIYPNIPHYYLQETHRSLMEQSEAYRDSVVETRGVFVSPEGNTSLIASLEESRAS